jgi:hypothetical protein
MPTVDRCICLAIFEFSFNSTATGCASVKIFKANRKYRLVVSIGGNLRPPQEL